MEKDKKTLREQNRERARDLVLDAAQRLLLANESADFSMRALASEAGVGFATPFNHFGSKAAIMQGLSTRLIARMSERFRAEAVAEEVPARVLAMGRIGTDVLLEQPAVAKAVVGSLSVIGEVPGEVQAHSRRLWQEALGQGRGLAPATRALALDVLPDQLAFGFRGCLSFWIAGEIDDAALAPAVRRTLAVPLLGFLQPAARAALLTEIGGMAAA